LFLAYASFMGFIVYQMDVKSAFLYGTIDKEVYVMQPPGFQDPEYPARVYKVEKAMGTIDQTLFIKRQRGDFILVQVYVDDIIFGSSNPQLCREFEALMHEKFQMSAMGELNFFFGLQVLQKDDGIFLSQDKYVGDILKKFGYSDVRSLNTPMDKENPCGKDGTGKDVDLHLYRSMIGSLMYLTASRPYIMFVVCACSKHQVTPKECHLHALLAAVDKFCGFKISCLIIDLLTKPFDAGRFQYLVSEQNVDFHPIVDFIEASLLRHALTFKPTIYVSHIRQFWSTARIKTTAGGTKILATVDGVLRTVTESSLRRNLKLQDEEGISSLPDTELFENLTLMGYNISPNQKFTFQKGQFSHQWKFLIHTTMHCLSPKSTGFNEFSSNIATALVCLATNRTYNFSKMSFDGLVKNIHNKVSKFLMYPRARIAQSSALPPVADEPASSVRDVSKGEACPTDSGFIADQDRATIAKSSTLPYDTAPRVTSPAVVEGSMQQTINELTALCTSLEIRMDEGEVAVERTSEDTEEMAIVLTSMDAATVLAGGIDVPTGSDFIPTAGPPVVDIHTGSDVVPTASLIVATATVGTPYLRKKGKEVMVESDTPKKQSLQDQFDAQGMIDSLDRTNETIAKYMQEYQDFALELPLERRIELISDLVKYQDNYSKIYKFQSQQRRPWTKKQKKDYYMTVIRNNLGWKVKDFKGMAFKEIEAKFVAVWKLAEDFIPIGSKEEAEMLKRKGFNLEQEKAKKQKTSEEVPDKEKSPEEIPKEKVKEMMQLVPIEEVYVQALQVKHPIIDWKHLDREDLNQLWVLVKEYLSIRPASSDKEMKLWVELKRLYEPDPKDQLWAQTQKYMHAPIEWKLYDLSGVHHVTAKDKEIFMLVEKRVSSQKRFSTCDDQLQASG
nr:hypothetical protein [Tanacetum cinerariifolium]